MLVSALLLEVFQRVGIVGETDSLTTGQSNMGLSMLNDMLDSWNMEGLLLPYKQTETFTMTQGSATQTIGPSGTFNTTRPVDINGAFVRQGGLDYDIRVIGFDAYQGIANKSQTTRPQVLMYQKATPIATLYFWPVPDQAYSLYLHSEKQWGALSTGTDFLPQPGVLDAVKTNLMIRVAPYGGTGLDPTIPILAANSLRALRRKNFDNSGTPTNMGLMQTRRGGYNVDRGW